MNLDGSGWFGGILAAGVLLAATGCGDDSGVVGGPEGAASAARLEGRYVVTLKPLDYEGERERSRWRLTPRCDAGPCDTTAKTGEGDRIDLRFDEDSDRYVGRAVFKADCVGRQSGRLLVKDAYRDRAKLILRPLETGEVDDAHVVTSFEGRSRRTLSVSRSARETFQCTIDEDERIETDRVKGLLVE